MSLAGRPFARRPGVLSYLLTCAVPVAAVLSLSMAARGDETAEMAEALMHANSLSKAFRHAAEQAIPSVVVVRSETKAKKVSANRTVLMVEHNMNVVASIADAITVLARGSVIAEGPYAVVSKNPQVLEAYMGSDAVELRGAHG